MNNECIKSHYYRDIHLEGDPIVEAIEDLQEDVEKLQEDVENINSRFTFEGRKFILLGDSWGHTNVSGLGMWADEFIARHPGQAVRYATDGGCWWYTTRKYIEELQRFDGDKTTITDIVVLGGYNDMLSFGGTGTQAQIDSEMANFKNYVKANYPASTKVWVGFIPWSRNQTDWPKLRLTAQAYRQFSAKYGFYYCNNIDYVSHDRSQLDTNLGSGYHPTPALAKKICYALEECLLTGTCQTFEFQAVTPSGATQFSGSHGTFSVVKENGITTFRHEISRGTSGYSSVAEYRLSSAKNAEFSKPLVLFQLDNNLWRGYSTNFDTGITINIGLGTIGGNYEWHPATLSINNGDLVLQSTFNQSGIDKVAIPAFVMNYGTMFV